MKYHFHFWKHIVHVAPDKVSGSLLRIKVFYSIFMVKKFPFFLVFVSPAEQERDLGVAISGNGGDGGGDGGGDSVGSVNFPRLKF